MSDILIDVNLVQGLVEAVGVSNYGPQQLTKIAKYLRARNVPLVTAQVLGHLIDKVHFSLGLSNSLFAYPNPQISA